MDFPVKPASFLISLTVLLTGCNNGSQSASVVEPTSVPTVSASPASPAPASPEPSPTAVETPETLVISPQGIGAAQLGMTLGELKQKLGSDYEFVVQSPFIVDFDAISVLKGGEVQYYILYLADQAFGDQDVIQGLLTDNAKYRTAEQVGPGTTLTEAETAYGEVTLSYNTDNESREYARFAQQPAKNLSFSTGNANTDAAGIYASPVDSYNETQQFKDNAVIESVLVVCLTEGCTQAAADSTP